MQNGITSQRQIEIGGISVEVVRKKIKNLHLRICPPEGHVRVSAPIRLSDEAIRKVIVSRLSWIRQHQTRFDQQNRQSPHEMMAGESLYFLGQCYQLDVIEQAGPTTIKLINNTTLQLRVYPGTNKEKREAILHQWYREQLRGQIPELLSKWMPKIGVTIAQWGIKKMKTRWGTCNVKARRIWLNLELAKKPVSCLEFILVHEMVHLLERHHNARFKAFMDQFMPEWRLHQDQLNRLL
ncbi:MAG: SprT family zinc-dependent metalloprotease [Nitrospirota bacterium]